jgi:hypothetical protein
VTIQPANFYIPPVIQAGLDADVLFRFGGVVRNSQGHIVKHLKEMPVTPEAQEAAARRLVASLKDHKGVVLFGLTAAGAAVGGVAYLSARKRKEAQARVDRYDASLKAYLEAVRAGTLDAGTVTRLIRDLDAVRAMAEKGTITVDFSTEPSATLVNLVVEYTKQLAEANRTTRTWATCRTWSRGTGPTPSSTFVATLRSSGGSSPRQRDHRPAAAGPGRSWASTEGTVSWVLEAQKTSSSHGAPPPSSTARWPTRSSFAHRSPKASLATGARKPEGHLGAPPVRAARALPTGSVTSRRRLSQATR